VTLPHPTPRVDDVDRPGGSVFRPDDRILVAGVVPPPRFGRENEVAATARAVAAAGADLVDVSLGPRLVGPAVGAATVPVVVTAASLDAAAAAGRAGAALALVPPDAIDAATAAELREVGVPLAAVVSDPGAVAGAVAVAAAAGVATAFDSTRLPAGDALAAESLAVADGCRLLRTADVRRSRRVAEVLGAVLAARRSHDAARDRP
jgi:hypothetical protein